MNNRKLIRIILDVLILMLALLFIVSLLYFMNGSIEVMPTPEQQGKAKITAIVLMLMAGVPCIACIGIRIKIR